MLKEQFKWLSSLLVSGWMFTLSVRRDVKHGPCLALNSISKGMSWKRCQQLATQWAWRHVTRQRCCAKPGQLPPKLHGFCSELTLHIQHGTHRLSLVGLWPVFVNQKVGDTFYKSYAETSLRTHIQQYKKMRSFQRLENRWRNFVTRTYATLETVASK